MIRDTGPPGTNLTELRSTSLTSDPLTLQSPLSLLYLPLITHSIDFHCLSHRPSHLPHQWPPRRLIAHLINAPCSPYRFCITDRTDSPGFSTQTLVRPTPPSFTHKPCVALHHLTDSREKPHYSPLKLPSLSKESHVLAPHNYVNALLLNRHLN